MISFGMMMRADDLNLRYHNHCTSVPILESKRRCKISLAEADAHPFPLFEWLLATLDTIHSGHGVMHDDCKGFKLEK